MVLAMVLLHQTMNTSLLNLVSKISELDVEDQIEIYTSCLEYGSLNKENPMEHLLIIMWDESTEPSESIED